MSQIYHIPPLKLLKLLFFVKTMRNNSETSTDRNICAQYKVKSRHYKWFLGPVYMEWGTRSSGVSFFCFHVLGDTKQKKLTPLHVNRLLGPVYMEVGDPR